MTTQTIGAQAMGIMRKAIDTAITKAAGEHLVLARDTDRFFDMVEAILEDEATRQPRDVALLLQTHGVERITETFDENGNGVSDRIEDGEEFPDTKQHSLTYLNSGDPYRQTVLYDHDAEELFVGAYGDWIENRDNALGRDPPHPEMPSGPSF